MLKTEEISENYGCHPQQIWQMSGKYLRTVHEFCI